MDDQNRGTMHTCAIKRHERVSGGKYGRKSGRWRGCEGSGEGKHAQINAKNHSQQHMMMHAQVATLDVPEVRLAVLGLPGWIPCCHDGIGEVGARIFRYSGVVDCCPLLVVGVLDVATDEDLQDVAQLPLALQQRGRGCVLAFLTSHQWKTLLA